MTQPRVGCHLAEILLSMCAIQLFHIELMCLTTVRVPPLDESLSRTLSLLCKIIQLLLLTISQCSIQLVEPCNILGGNLHEELS